jgi:hypothetical protein
METESTPKLARVDNMKYVRKIQQQTETKKYGLLSSVFQLYNYDIKILCVGRVAQLI